MESKPSLWPTRWRFTAAMLSLYWVLSFLGPLSFLILFFLGFAMFRAASRRAWPPLILMIAANPLTLFFVGGVVDYSKGNPTIRSMGLPSFEFFNLDPQTLCFRSTGGCVVSGHEWVSHELHNLGVLAAVTAFGPPPGSYDGPYPAKQEALHLIADAPDLNPKDFQKGRVQAGGRMIQLDPTMIGEWGMMFGMFELMDGMEPDSDSGIRAQAFLLEGRCLILRLSQKDTYHGDVQDFIILLDARNRRPFAYYCIQGSPTSRIPRVQYQPRASQPKR